MSVQITYHSAIYSWQLLIGPTTTNQKADPTEVPAKTNTHTSCTLHTLLHTLLFALQLLWRFATTAATTVNVRSEPDSDTSQCLNVIAGLLGCVSHTFFLNLYSSNLN